MWVTKKTDYATRVLLVLAMDDSGELMTLNDLAVRTSTPRSTVEQVMSRLRDGGLVRAERGALGGYRLNRDPDEITIDEVVREADALSASKSRMPRQATASWVRSSPAATPAA